MESLPGRRRTMWIDDVRRWALDGLLAVGLIPLAGYGR